MKFSQGDRVRLKLAPAIEYTVLTGRVTDTSDQEKLHNYDPPHFYELRTAYGGVAHWPESCLELATVSNPWMRAYLENVYRNIRDRYPPERAEKMIETLREGIKC